MSLVKAPSTHNQSALLNQLDDSDRVFTYAELKQDSGTGTPFAFLLNADRILKLDIYDKVMYLKNQNTGELFVGHYINTIYRFSENQELFHIDSDLPIFKERSPDGRTYGDLLKEKKMALLNSYTDIPINGDVAKRFKALLFGDSSLIRYEDLLVNVSDTMSIANILILNKDVDAIRRLFDETILLYANNTNTYIFEYIICGGQFDAINPKLWLVILKAKQERFLNAIEIMVRRQKYIAEDHPVLKEAISIDNHSTYVAHEVASYGQYIQCKDLLKLKDEKELSPREMYFINGNPPKEYDDWFKELYIEDVKVTVALAVAIYHPKNIPIDDMRIMTQVVSQTEEEVRYIAQVYIERGGTIPNDNAIWETPAWHQVAITACYLGYKFPLDHPVMNKCLENNVNLAVYIQIRQGLKLPVDHPGMYYKTPLEETDCPYVVQAMVEMGTVIPIDHPLIDFIESKGYRSPYYGMAFHGWIPPLNRMDILSKRDPNDSNNTVAHTAAVRGLKFPEDHPANQLKNDEGDRPMDYYRPIEKPKKPALGIVK